MKKLLLLCIGVVGWFQLALATTCPNAIPIPAVPTLPYTQSLVCGTTDDINAGNSVACGSNFYVGGLESVYTWTPTYNYSNVSIAYSGQTWSGIMVYNGCPTSGGTCVANVTSSAASKTLTIPNITAGVTYYIVFDTWPSPASPCPGTFTMNGTMLIPATPPAPVQAAGTPACGGTTTLTVSGTAPANETWYWQTTATGTSTANPVSGPFAVTANGTYYVRSYSTTLTAWSMASSVTVSNFPTATAVAPTPVAAQNPTCVTTGTTISVPAAPAGVQYYWQGTVAQGSSMAMPATAPYTVNATGTYYVAAYETATQCWSTGAGVSVTANSVIPPAPVAAQSVYNFCTSDSPMNIAATPAFSPGPQCSVTATASGTDNTGVTATITNFACSPGTVASATLNATIGTNCPNWYYYSIVVNGTTVATQQCNQTNFDLTPYLPLTSVSIVSADNPSDNVGDGVTMNLTVNLTFQGTAYGVDWFSAATAGTQVGTGTTLNTIGTSVMPTAANGTYSYYAGSNAAGCPSATRTLVTVNVNDVNATVTPVDATCNGGSNGTFTVSNITCGTQPFTYSLDGGPFQSAPMTNITVGTHTVQIRDANNLLSAPMQIVINSPDVPQDLQVDDVNYFNAFVSWDPQGSETSWIVYYGPAGFDPATEGESFTATSSTNVELTDLEANTEYDFYVAANCGAMGMSDAFTFSTNPGFFTFDNACGPGFIDISGTGTALNLTDDGTTTVTSGFPLNIQGSESSTITVSNNGWISYTGTNGFVGLDVFSIDLDDEEGNVYYQTMTVNGEELFIVEWFNRPRFSTVSGQNVTFEVIVNNTTGEVFYVYQDAVFGGSQSGSDNGLGSLIQAAGPQETVTVSSYNDDYLLENSCVRFFYTLCPNPTDIEVIAFENEALVSWEAGEYGETEWTVVYGPAGFDPATEGTTIEDHDDNTISLPNLEQNTEYDVYVYSECDADNLTSDNGLFGNFTTKPYCSTPTGLTAATDIDSLEAAWNWVLNPNQPTYAVEGFNIEYGWTGFELGDGVNVLSSNGTATNDTIVNGSYFIAGGVYEVYVQAVCGQGDSVSGWAGPVTFTMPLSNDLVCGADMLEADGTVYTFNNTGATVSTGEGAVAPAATGAQTTDGWINSTLNNTVWFTFEAPASGSVRINSTGLNYNGQAAVYTVDDCENFATFTMLNANDNAIGGTSLAPNFTVCGLTEGETYYLLFDGFNGTTGMYNLSISPIVLEAGIAPETEDVCTGENVELFDIIEEFQEGGVWSSTIPAVNASIAGSDLETEGLAYTTFNIQYRVTDGCAYDSIMAMVHVFPPSNAGTDGTITACRNEPIDLLAGLNDNADLEGTWYGPNDLPIGSSQISASNVQGSYSYDYIAGNGVCPNDTALVVVNVAACNFLSLEEELFSGVEIFPNPSEGIVFITSDLGFTYEVTDANGRLIAQEANGVKAAQKSQIDLSNAETGVYFIRLSNEQAQKTYRVVIR